MNKKAFSLLTGGILAALILAGCGSGEKTSSTHHPHRHPLHPL